jgi:mycofactocin system FadH/OYE family oxidoreductase 1
MKLLSPIGLGPLSAPNRVLFGPHVTNLGDDRVFSSRHVAYYSRRARGGCGVIVVEEASVHASDWPYERSPLASACGEGWSAIARACHVHGSLVIAALGHAGGQGSSAYSQRELWAPSRVPEVNAREVPKWMEAEDIAAVVSGFRGAAALAVASGCDGVEINAGQHSMIRQFLSGLTNHRDDEWGTDRLRFAREVLTAVRSATAGKVVGLRLSCDELAPWAGITPDQAPEIAAALCADGLVDYLVVTRGSIFSVEQTRADFHQPAMVNVDVCRDVKAAVTVPVFLQGAVVEAGAAEWAIGEGVCDGVEMTRAQIADADLVAKVRSGAAPRPCIRCNQTCQVRDARNPIVTCVGDPSSGFETTDAVEFGRASVSRSVLVVGAGPAGLEAARVAAARGHQVRVVERAASVGGLAAAAGPGGVLVQWLADECRWLGVTVDLSTTVSDLPAGDSVIVATGSQPGVRDYAVAAEAVVLDVGELRLGRSTLPEDGTIVLFDPIGGPIAVALAEQLGDRAVLITQDNIAGNELSRTGDLAPANSRLQQRGVTIERRSLLREVGRAHVVVEDRYSGVRRAIACVAVVDCGFRLADDQFASHGSRVGDCVAPRTLLEAIREGRAAALAIP